MISRRAKRVTLGLAFGFLALLLFITLLNRYFAALELRQRLEEERAEIGEPAPLIHTVVRETEIRTRAFSARLQPWNDARIAAEVPGRVEAIAVEPGDPVEAGDVLVRLDNTLAAMRVDTAEAALATAGAQLREFERQQREAERLAASRAVPESRVEEARSRVEVQASEIDRLTAEAERAREEFRRHAVRAPFPGVAGERLVETGDSVTAYQPVIGLAALDPLRVVFHVGEDETAFLAPGTNVDLRLPGRAESLPVEVGNLSPVADRRTGTVRAEARLPNPDLAFRGGTTGVVEARIGLYDGSLFVPGTAVRYDGRQAYVDRLGEGEEAEATEVELGPEIRGKYPVVSGLREGDRIVVR